LPLYFNEDAFEQASVAWPLEDLHEEAVTSELRKKRSVPVILLTLPAIISAYLQALFRWSSTLRPTKLLASHPLYNDRYPRRKKGIAIPSAGHLFDPGLTPARIRLLGRIRRRANSGKKHPLFSMNWHSSQKGKNGP
jgi:hypothetical protein